MSSLHGPCIHVNSTGLKLTSKVTIVLRSGDISTVQIRSKPRRYPDFYNANRAEFMCHYWVAHIAIGEPPALGRGLSYLKFPWR